MKVRLLTLPLVCFTVLMLSAVSARSQTVITFDDLVRNTGTGSDIPNNYQGLAWSNVGAINAVLSTNILGVAGYYYGMVSASNVAVLFGSNTFGIANSEIDSPSTNFNFLSAYLTGAWNSNLNIEVQGFNGSILAYDTTVVANATSPTLFRFDYFDINRLYFNSYGGQPAFGVSGGEYVSVMDNFEFEFIPEPSSLLLTALGAVTLLAFHKRKRA